MKIGLLTTLPGLEENNRIAAEVAIMGHEFSLVDMRSFGFLLKDGKTQLASELPEDLDVLIIRGVFLSIKAITTITQNLRKTGLKVFDNNFMKHRYTIDKITDILRLSYAGIPVPTTGYSRDYTDWLGIASKIGYPVILKSTRAGKGFNVFKLNSEQELNKLKHDLVESGKNAKSYLLQQFFDYEHDLRCLVIGRNVFTMKRIPAEGEFRANFSLGGSVEPFDLSEDDRKLAIEALEAVNMSIGGVDILIGKNGERVILEVNHTAGFIGMEQALGQNIGKIWVEHAISEAK